MDDTQSKFFIFIFWPFEKIFYFILFFIFWLSETGIHKCSTCQNRLQNLNIKEPIQILLMGQTFFCPFVSSFLILQVTTLKGGGYSSQKLMSFNALTVNIVMTV